MRTPEPPPLTDDLESLCAGCACPTSAGALPEVIATARAQRWEPTEILKALLTEELTAGNARRWPPGARRPPSPRARPSTPGIPKPPRFPAPRSRAAHPRVGEATREPGGVRAVGDGKDLLLRGAWSDSRRGRHQGGVVHPGGPRGPGAASPGRRLGDQGGQPHPRFGVDRDRRHWPVAGVVRRRRGLYRLVDAAYEKRSVAVSSNLHPAGFDEIMPKTLATATVDRLLHHAHLCETGGESVRLQQATAGKGVTPLT